MKKNTNASNMALGGVFAALAVTIMAMGTFIPVATYVCPVLCMLLLQIVFRICGKRTAWAWYFAVAILSLLMAPDKEAALVFLSLGYYPIIKVWMEHIKWRLLVKASYFNVSILMVYDLMLNVLGLEQVAADLAEAGWGMTVLLLVLGNITFFLLDRLLTMGLSRFIRR